MELVEEDVVQRLNFGGENLRPSPPSPIQSNVAGASLVADDPLLVQQWHHRQIGAEAAWLRSTGEGVVVAVIDSGVRSGADCRR